MKEYLIYKDEKSSKFWQIEVDGKKQIVTFGKIDNPGQSKIKEFDSAEEAKKDAEKKIVAKINKGYHKKKLATKVKAYLKKNNK